MERLGVEHSDERISFGQIYGMGEQISIPLGTYNNFTITIFFPLYLNSNYTTYNTNYRFMLYFLASAGYIVYKSVPFGPVNTLLPYFARRAAENRVVLQGTRK